MPDTDLPTDVLSGKVVARLIKTVADAGDPGALPDEIVIEGTVKFSPRVTVYKNPNPNLAVVVPGIVVCDIDSEGYLVSNGERGVWLPEGAYRVTYRLLNARIRTHLIVVLPEHTDENPLNLVGSIPPAGPVGTSGEYASLSARIDALNGVSTDDPRLSDARPPTAHNHDDRYFTEGEIEAKLADIPTTQDLENESTARQTAVSEVWDTLNEEVSARSAADDGFNVRIELLEEGTVDLSDYPTVGEMVTALSGKANTSHSHTSAAITDFREAVEDAMAATLVGAGVTITHEDGSDTITLTGVGGADVEAVRDAIGAALVGVGPISIVPNDSGDTIVITVSATVNSTDAALRDRSTHTGTQTISTVNGLQAALDNKAATTDPPVSHGNSHKKDTGSDPITPADIGAATAAQGAKADTAVQPAALSAYATAAQGAKADTAVQPSALSAYATVGSVASGGLWRGPWAALTSLYQYSLLTLPGGWSNPGGWSSAVTPTTGNVTGGGYSGTIPGTPPTGGYVLRAAPFFETKYFEFTVPAGATTSVRMIATLTGGSIQPGNYSYMAVNVNGINKYVGQPNGWTPITVAAIPGDVVRVHAIETSVFSTAIAVGQIELMTTSAPYMMGSTVTYLGRMWRSLMDNNTSTPGVANWEDLNIVVDPADIVGSTTFGQSVLTAANVAAIGAATTAQGAKADTAVQPAGISSAVATALAGVSKWRGIWSSIALIKAWDPIVDGLDDGTLTVVNVSPPLAAIATSSVPAVVTGTPPLAANVYRISQQASGGSVPYGAYSVQWDMVAPAGATQVRFKHGIATGPGGYGNAYVYVNGVVKRAVGEVSAPWLAFTETIAPGQVLRFYNYAPFNGSAASYVGDLEFWGAADPYLTGDLVYYNGQFYQCASGGTTATPGADGTWTPLPTNEFPTVLTKTAGYTVTTSDHNKKIVMNSSSNMSVTIPTDATENIPIGFQADYIGLGTGLVTFMAATPGTTSVVGVPSLTTLDRYSAASLLKIAANSWVVIGRLA